ncbi:GFA family protein [Pseudosulfitobacter pseudonitzschiae]
MTALRVDARCHCGAVHIRATLPEGLQDVARCDCSFCRRRGAAAVTALAADLEVVKGAENLTLYSFGTHTAQHHFCKTCGIYTHITGGGPTRRNAGSIWAVSTGSIRAITSRSAGRTG